MASGGSRNRSGPQADPSSGRSDRRGVKLTALPAEGFDGDIPSYPLPKRDVFNVYFEDKARVREFDEGATEAQWERELDLWEWAWRTPQACAWAMPSERWRHMAIAQWVRTSVVCESSEATAADKNSLHRFADQIGLTPAGLKENGWAVAVDQVSAKAAEKGEAEPAVKQSARDRMKVMSGGA